MKSLNVQDNLKSKKTNTRAYKFYKYLILFYNPYKTFSKINKVNRSNNNRSNFYFCINFQLLSTAIIKKKLHHNLYYFIFNKYLFYIKF